MAGYVVVLANCWYSVCPTSARSAAGIVPHRRQLCDIRVSRCVYPWILYGRLCKCVLRGSIRRLASGARARTPSLNPSTSERTWCRLFFWPQCLRNCAGACGGCGAPDRRRHRLRTEHAAAPGGEGPAPGHPLRHGGRVLRPLRHAPHAHRLAPSRSSAWARAGRAPCITLAMVGVSRSLAMGSPADALADGACAERVDDGARARARHRLRGGEHPVVKLAPRDPERLAEKYLKYRGCARSWAAASSSH